MPGCVSAGATAQEAALGAEKALSGHLAVMIEHGDALPKPSELDVIVAVRVRVVAAAIRGEFDKQEEVARWVTPLMLMRFALACLAQFLPRRRRAGAQPAGRDRSRPTGGASQGECSLSPLLNHSPLWLLVPCRRSEQERCVRSLRCYVEPISGLASRRWPVSPPTFLC
ncbi:type II toxin-antitoxin system HicB family antitoxin [Sphingomonas phyllosphaerae]|uniref:type II toxin-antitoxin system HicB family antitoxin n=1 Tax=Sphingomonas phyllosphaerae TaxID=257003 RepID=UPI0024130EDE|nr:type II toxin-antitoxin system HicB family antitoxin [Sphingomonas phyllosphaerae]